MSRIKGLAVVIGSAALLMAVVACGNGEANGTELEPATGAPSAPITAPAPAAEPEPAIGVPAVAVAPAPVPEPEPAIAVPSAPVVAVAPALPPAQSTAPAIAPLAPQTSGSARALPSYSGSPLLQVSGSQSGIWVTGQGRLSLEPDLALVNLGVEAMAPTVAEARDEAATAMAAILAAVKAQGLTDKDVQTRSFNIWPRYEFPEVIEDGVRVRKQTLVGYTVSNTASVKIRNMDKVGVIIDDVAAAGGDTIRINGISFTVEDTSPYMTELREAAVNDALAKASHFAGLTGVAVGQLTFIAEIGSGTPVVQNFQEDAFAKVASAASIATSISGGELELSLNVQAVFEIQ